LKKQSDSPVFKAGSRKELENSSSGSFPQYLAQHMDGGDLE
jgi:hypothetical protein